MASSPRTGQVTTQDRIRSFLGQYGIGVVLIIMMLFNWSPKLIEFRQRYITSIFKKKEKEA